MKHSDVDEHWMARLRASQAELDRANSGLTWEIELARMAGVTWKKINEAIGGSHTNATQRKYSSRMKAGSTSR